MWRFAMRWWLPFVGVAGGSLAALSVSGSRNLSRRPRRGSPAAIERTPRRPSRRPQTRKATEGVDNPSSRMLNAIP